MRASSARASSMSSARSAASARIVTLSGRTSRNPPDTASTCSACFVANGHNPIAQRREQRDVLRQDSEVALDAGREHEVGLLAEDATLRRDEFDLELGHAGYSLVVSSGLAAVAVCAGAVSSDARVASVAASVPSFGRLESAVGPRLVRLGLRAIRQSQPRRRSRQQPQGVPRSSRLRLLPITLQRGGALHRLVDGAAPCRRRPREGRRACRRGSPRTRGSSPRAARTCPRAR